MRKQSHPIEPLIHTATGKQEADLVFKNADVLNVFTQEILRADVAVVDGRIAGVGNYSAANQVDCTGLTLCPGLIDAHCHIESSMATPAEFSRAVLPSGTTTLIADPHEIVNVCGARGLQFMLDAADHAVCDILYMLPSCVPATEFETSGADFSAADMQPFLQHPRVLGLAEVMNFPGVLSAETAMLDKIKLFDRMMIDGHAPGISGNALQAYVAAGIASDHEATGFAEALEKARAGLAVLVRQGSAAQDLEALLSGVLQEKLSTRRFMMCTDDKHLDDIHRYGHIVHNIRMAIDLGFPPIEAITMASYNTAEHFGLRDRGAIAAGRRADLLLVSDLQTMKIEAVYQNGTSADTLLQSPSTKREVPSDILNSIHLKLITEADIQLKADGVTDVMGMIPGQILTRHLQEAVPVENGFFKPSQTYAKLCVLERHGKNGNIAVAPLKGYGIQGGAVATSVAHDSHNIIVAGDNDSDIVLAVNHLRTIGGGYVVVNNGTVIGSLPLQVAGLMSLESHTQVEQLTETVLAAARTLHIADGIDPFISLSFMALPVIPTLRLTDQGLIDLFTS